MEKVQLISIDKKQNGPKYSKNDKSSTLPRLTYYNIYYNYMFFNGTSGTKPIIVSAGHVHFLLHQREKKMNCIQYGYKKWGTRARVFSQTLAHGNGKNEIRKRNRRRM